MQVKRAWCGCRGDGGAQFAELNAQGDPISTAQHLDFWNLTKSLHLCPKALLSLVICGNFLSSHVSLLPTTRSACETADIK